MLSAAPLSALGTPCVARVALHRCRRLPLGETFRDVSLHQRPVVTQAAKSSLSEEGRGRRKQSTKKAKDILAEDPEIIELMKIVELLPKNVRKTLHAHRDLHHLLEVVMDLGRVPFARFPEGDVDLAKATVTSEDLEFATSKLGEFGGDNRAGISGTLHRISCIKNRKGSIIGLTARVGRHVSGSAEIVADIINKGKSVLLLGYPGTGKTTAIRSMCKLLADAEKRRVVVVDTSNEIAGDGDVPHIGIGKARRMQVSHPNIQHEVMIEAVENHMPQVIVIDEIGTELECLAARTISQRGVQLIATAHATELENLIKNPHLQDLIGGVEVVTLGDEEARRRRAQKSVLERAGPPAFDVAIEMVERDLWRIHHNLAEAVDTILAGGTAHGEMRTHPNITNVDVEVQKRPSPPTLPIVHASPLISIPFAAQVADKRFVKTERPSEKEAQTPSPVRGKRLTEDDIRSHQKEDSFYEEWSGDSDWDFFSAPAPSPSSETKAPSTVVLRLFLIGVEQQHLQEILEVLGLKGKIAVTAYLKKAHAVLGLQAELRSGGWVEKAARVARIPLFSLDSNSNMALAKAIQSLLGLSSSTQTITVKEEKRQEETIKERENNENKAFEELSSAEYEALDEVRLAIEDIIIPRNQPVDLMPQIPHIRQMQMDMIGDYDFPYETVGEGNHTHIRIYPPGDTPSEASDF